MLQFHGDTCLAMERQHLFQAYWPIISATHPSFPIVHHMVISEVLAWCAAHIGIGWIQAATKYSLFLHTQTLCLRIVDPCMELRIGPLPPPPFPGDTYRASNATGVHKITCMQTNGGKRHAITRQHGIRDCQAEQTRVAERHMESIVLL